MINSLTLAQAQASERLSEFIAQEEARGIGPIDCAEFDGAVANLLKAQRLEDRTSHSASDGNSSGKRTRQDTDQDVSS
jgi:hypothetical protein